MKKNIKFLVIPIALASLLIIGVSSTSAISYAQNILTPNNQFNNNSSSLSNDSTSSPGSIPNAQSVYDTGIMSLPASVKGVIIFIPDEAHHPPADDKTISPKNPNYLPSTLEIPQGTEVAFVQDDPNHVHVGIVKDNSGNDVWTTRSR